MSDGAVDLNDEITVDTWHRGEYQAIIDGERRDGPRGRVMFCVSTSSLDDKRGDLFVALGLARALSNEGWGVSVWPLSRLAQEAPEDVDVAIVMTETFIPGMLPHRTRAVAWVRNWTEKWAALPYLTEFSQIWCSSTASAERLAEVYSGELHVVPLAADTELFRPLPIERNAEIVTTANYWGIARDLTDQLVEVAKREPVTWFGTNSLHLRLDGTISHRDAIDYFALPWVYSRWLLVVDDVIPAAAEYGTQNSRLFDAIACGAIVATNTANGLAELGLDEVPVYESAGELVAIVDRLRGDPERTVALAAHLQGIVRERHSTAARARQVGPLLDGMIESDREPEPRSALIRWATRERETLLDVETDRSAWRTRFLTTQDENDRLRAQVEAQEGDKEDLRRQLADAHASLAAIRQSRGYRLAVLITRPVRAVARIGNRDGRR